MTARLGRWERRLNPFWPLVDSITNEPGAKKNWVDLYYLLSPKEYKRIGWLANSTSSDFHFEWRGVDWATMSMNRLTRATQSRCYFPFRNEKMSWRMTSVHSWFSFPFQVGNRLPSVATSSRWVSTLRIFCVWLFHATKRNWGHGRFIFTVFSMGLIRMRQADYSFSQSWSRRNGKCAPKLFWYSFPFFLFFFKLRLSADQECERKQIEGEGHVQTETIDKLPRYNSLSKGVDLRIGAWRNFFPHPPSWQSAARVT